MGGDHLSHGADAISLGNRMRSQRLIICSHSDQKASFQGRRGFFIHSDNVLRDDGHGDGRQTMSGLEDTAVG